MEERVVMEFEGGYGRDGKIYISNGICTICSAEKIVISSDGSEGEYASAYLCLDCVTIEIGKGI